MKSISLGKQAIYSLVSAMLLGVGALHAAPYGPEGLATEFSQPGVGNIALRVFGDEFHARTETSDGYTVVLDKVSGQYFYATLTPDGQDLTSTGVAVGTADPLALNLAKHVSIPPAAAKAAALARFQKWDKDTGTSQLWSDLKQFRQAAERAQSGDGPQPAPPSFTTTGAKKGLTLLIDFSDDPATIPQASIIDFCNGDNYTGYGNNGSVKKYYQDNSNNLLTYTNVVTAYIRMAQPKTYYNDTSKDCGAQGNLLIKDALDILKALPNYTAEILPLFNDLTVDASNRIVACNVFYAGGNGGAWTYGLWPHSWSLYNVGAQELSAGGKKVYKYQITNIGNSLELGTFCHENGHMLCGYPDIYDYGYDSVGGAGGFCLMNSGGHGTNPVMICAYLKRASGWTTETNLTSTTNLTGSLTSTLGHNDYNKLYRYAKPGTSTEYFLFENRRKTGRDTNIAASGIAIWHIDELGNKDNQSLTPNATHANYEVTLVQADNLWHFQNNTNSGDSKDLYYLGNTAAGYTNIFSDNSSPNAHWWSGANSGLNVYNISAAGATMTLQFGLPANTIAIRTPNGGDQVYLGTTQTVTWDATTTGNVKIELYKTGALHTVLSASESNDGNYSWSVSPGLTAGNDYTLKISSVDNPAYSDTSDAAFSILSDPVAAALDTPDLVWTRGGSSNWFSQTTTTHDGVDAAQSGVIDHSQSNSIQTTLVESGTLTFWWKVSSESGYDYLRFYLDGVEQTGSLAKISGSVDWVQKTVAITSGSHTVKWEYAKDGSVVSGSDAAWVDQVVFTPTPRPEIAVEQPVGTGLSDGTTSIACGSVNLGSSSAAVTFTVKNTGTATLTGLVLTKDGTNPSDFSLGSLGATSLAAGTSTTFTATFSPSASGSRTAAIHLASNDADENPFDITLTGSGIAIPEIVVEQPSGTGLSDGSATVDLGSANLGSSSAAVTFTVRNTGTGTLTGLALTKDGTNPSDFSLGSLGATSLAAGASTTFTATFSPSASGSRTAAIHLASNDADENPFDITLTGHGRTPLEAWRFDEFGSDQNSGESADDANSDGDRIPNLMEYALALDPQTDNPFPFTSSEDGTTVAITYPRNLAATDVAVSFEESSDLGLTDDWSPATVVETNVGPPSNGVQSIKASHTPPPGQNRVFLRMKVTPLP